MMFNKDQCIVNNKDCTRMFVANRQDNLYKIGMDKRSTHKVSYLVTVK